MKKFIQLILISLFLLTCSNPEEDFQKAKQKNTIEAYEKFLIDYPKSDFVDATRQHLMRLKYNKADSICTVEAYEKFIKLYPNTELSLQAKEKIYLLERLKKEDVIRLRSNYLESKNKLTSDQLWISSIPVGVEISICKYRSSSSVEAIVVGITPIVCELKPGKYLVCAKFPREFTIIPDTTIHDSQIFCYSAHEYFADIKSGLHHSWPNAKAEHLIIMRDLVPRDEERQIEYSCLRWYKIEKLEDKSSSLIISFLPRYNSLPEIEKYYPKSKNYEISEEQLENILANNNLDNYDLISLKSLLERGGKISLMKDDIYIDIEVDALNRLKVIKNN